MQDNLRLVLWSIIGVGAAWFLMMAINRHLFSNTNINAAVYGSIAMNKTDIGNRCGAGYQNSPELVEYKLTADGKMVYLCPQGIWPLQKTVPAFAVTDELRLALPANQLVIVNTYYSTQPKQAPMNPFVPQQ